MNLYRVTNGYYANGPIAVLAIAETEQSAIEIARSAFKREERSMFAKPLFSEQLEAEIVFTDTTIAQCTSVIECSEDLIWDIID